MYTTPVTSAEADVWIATLHLQHVEHGPDASWTVGHAPASRPWTLHHSALLLHHAAEILRNLRRTAPEAR
ncbi:hypothetical protein FFZ77_18970 [Streptomyces katsurahamanus]|uniref:DinB-like domain-containing protein n=1 Tax=Streptomyces katsurahamanus TaxID=2577098 RepID=A0ABW9NWH1_9ACTN|nr:hypothetical protein [Streptomyces katsurahamanus]